MGIFTNFKKLFVRSDPSDERQWTGLVEKNSASGVGVTPDSAMRVAAVYACVTVLAESLAGLPLILYRRSGNERKRENAHPLYKLLHDKPNRWQTSFEFREMLMGHVLLRGNGYAHKVYGSRGEIIELVPLNPTRVTPKMRPDGVFWYEFRPASGQMIEIPTEDIFHVKGYSPDGLIGTSAIAHAREAVGLALVSEEFGSRTFANDAQPGGVLEHPGVLTDQVHDRLKKSIDGHRGVANARKWMVLEQGMKFSKIAMTADDTQWIETRKFQIEEIARLFRVPLHLIGDLNHATFSNIEHQSLNFVQHTLLPWFKRWEQAIAERLFTESEREEYYVEFLADGLLRGDLQSRYNSYAVARQWGWLSADDVRRLENLDPLPDGQGEKYLIPMNMIDANRLDEVIDSQIKKGSTNDPILDQGKEPPTQAKNNQSNRNNGVFEAFQPVLRDLVKRYEERISKSKKPFKEHVEVIREGLKPVVEGIFLLCNERSAEIQGEITLKSFITRWEEKKDASTEERIADLFEIIGRINSIEVVTVVKDENRSPIVNLHVTQPPQEEVSDQEVRWEVDKDGQRVAKIRKVKRDKL